MSDVDLRKLFSERADSLPEDAELEISAVEAVRQCLPAIRRAKKKKTSWETIATIVRDIVQESLGIELRLTGNTVRYYYYQLTPKKRRSVSATANSKPRSPSTPTTSRKSSAPTPAQALQPATPAITPETVPAPEPVARSLAVSTPLPEPESGSEISLAACESPPDQKEAPKPERQKRSTRPKNSTFTRGYEGLNYL